MPGEPVDDSELLGKAQAGDAQAFGDLYERYAPSIYRYLLAHLQHQLDAEDLTGEVFLKAWQALPRYDQRGVPFLAFLFRIARNTLFDHYRHGTPLSDMPPLAASLTDHEPGPVEVLSQKAEHQEVTQTLRQLRSDYQTVLVLRFISDLSPEETAQVMQRSQGAVRVLQHRALTALRKLIQS